MKTVETKSASSAADSPEQVDNDEVARSLDAPPATDLAESAWTRRLRELRAGRHSTLIFRPDLACPFPMSY